MKKYFSNYYSFFVYSFCVILFIISIYNIAINVKHAIFLNEKVIVNDHDSDYKKFKDNILLIENNLKDNTQNNGSLTNILLMLKKNGVFRLLPGDKLSYLDLYKLNNYFIDIINEGWIMNVTNVNELDTKHNNEYVDILLTNANYLSKELLNNSNFFYTSNNNIRNIIEEEYKYILSNYQKFSYLILEISNKMEKYYD